MAQAWRCQRQSAATHIRWTTISAWNEFPKDELSLRLQVPSRSRWRGCITVRSVRCCRRLTASPGGPGMARRLSSGSGCRRSGAMQTSWQVSWGTFVAALALQDRPRRHLGNAAVLIGWCVCVCCAGPPVWRRSTRQRAVSRAAIGVASKRGMWGGRMQYFPSESCQQGQHAGSWPRRGRSLTHYGTAALKCQSIHDTGDVHPCPLQGSRRSWGTWQTTAYCQMGSESASCRKVHNDTSQGCAGRLVNRQSIRGRIYCK